MRRAIAVLVAFVTLVTVCRPAEAITQNVNIFEKHFNPKLKTMAFDDTVSWTNDDDFTHTVQVTVKPGGAFSTTINGGDTSTPVSWFSVVGTFRYKCTIHRKMPGAIGVLVKSDAPSKPLGTQFNLSWAGSPGGTLQYDIAVKDPGSTRYVNLLRDQISNTGSFYPRKKGVYKVRGRTQRISTGESTDWSPPTTLTVT